MPTSRPSAAPTPVPVQGPPPQPGAARLLPGSFWRRLLPVLALLALVTRTPSFARPLWNPDEGFLATQARQLEAGGALYETVVDRKPPLLPWLYEAAFAVFGDGSLWPLRAAAVVAVLTGAVLLASLARRRWGDRAGVLAGVCYVLASVGLVPEDTQAATFEVFMLPWTVLAMWCADRGRWAGAGLAVAAAALTKQTGGAVLLPVLWLLWQSRCGSRAAARLLGAAALPVLASALALGPGRLLFWTVTGSGDYASVDGAAAHAALRAAANAALLAGGCLPVVLAALYARRRGGKQPRDGGGTRTADVWVWLGASAAAVTAGFQFFGHYFLQLTPALALLAAAALRHLRGRPLSAALAVQALVTAGFLLWALLAPNGELAHQQRLAAEIRSRTAPSERVLLWGMHPETYWLADRAPASRYLTAGFLTNFSGGRGGVRVGERYAMDGAWPYFEGELRRDPPALVVDDSRGKPYAVRHTPTLRAYLGRHYERAGTVGGAVLYVRVQRPAD
ncbi:4-amino-4-deoxy-L-arabinose transferase [Streptomyces sp. WMMB 714]|uniref:glycosyltransferase family 39 protein n=1 Tax=Streptomyces sp. WMMB 714 TaxID=1286822 RepID=UPI0005F82E58|nr:glycosyltransferase family 39 protein [Streptomyces sp. WMMB 714]SCK43222.1 4-amino-4-deoxy-L-arabinose transferase [Streptomyces sp. WMMB 714]